MFPARKSARLNVPENTVERILCRYYDRLTEWGEILTRGDRAAAEEIIQDLCLHLTVAQPDLSTVRDLDSYLFICLKNMYTSSLAKVSRERLRVIQVEDYDSIAAAISTVHSGDVDLQNELLRICTYAVWRKYKSKSASHFILHFLLGYGRSDVARLARLPVAVIYNKLKEFRSELREYLSSAGKVRILSKNAPPEPQLLTTPASTDSLFGELRSLVFDGKEAGCLAESVLLEPYGQPGSPPVSCSELAHLAGCQRCLTLVEQFLRIEDHEGPLDGVGTDQDAVHTSATGFDAMMRTVRRRHEQLLERRPEVLAIAVNGRVVAFHKVESVHNALSSRIDSTTAVQFIEVFDEFGDRFAYLPFEEQPALIRSQGYSQQIRLSDDRWLRLVVRFDGLGAHAEVEYIDPALVVGTDWQDDTADELTEHQEPSRRLKWLQAWRPLQWAVVGLVCLVLAIAAGRGFYRYEHPSWPEVLTRLQSAVETPTAEEAIHQVLRIEEAGKPEGMNLVAFVDVWQAGDGRSVRRLYDARQQLLATSMCENDGTSVERPGERNAETDTERDLLESGAWRTGFSKADMRAGDQEQGEAIRTAAGFKLTLREPAASAVQSRTFELDRDYHVQQERVRLATARGISEFRLVRSSFERVPNRSVPNGTFSLPTEKEGYGLHGQQEPIYSGNPRGHVDQADLQVEVLYALFSLNADTGEPIDVTAMPDGRVRVQGTVTDPKLLPMLEARMKNIAEANRVVFQVHTAAQATEEMRRSKSARQEIITAGGETPAAPLVRAVCAETGLTGEALVNAEIEFSEAALAHGQSALQHAYALDRLGRILVTSGASSLTPEARLQWIQMVEEHSSKARTELQALRSRLNSLSIVVPAGSASVNEPITDPAEFARRAAKLRGEAEAVNRQVIDLFAGRAANTAPDQVQAAVGRLLGELPIGEAGRLDSAASRLAKLGQTAGEVGETRSR